MNPITAPTFNTTPIIAVPPAGRTNPAAAGESGANAFKSILADSIQQVQNSQNFAGQTIQQFMSGDNQDLHEVAIASQKAELSFEFFLQARNKVVAAYQEVMKLQL
jgi:flagellar hook-basal body complex protein FliE